MHGTALWFFLSAVFYVICGMLFGIWMSATHDHSLAPVHGHLNLIGWVTMAIFGLYYHLVPAAGESRLARLHFVVATIGLWIIVPGIKFAVEGTGETLAKIGSMVTILSLVLFAFIVVRSGRRTV